MKGHKKNKTGRIKPKYQTKKNADMILTEMRNGRSLREVCKANDWPLTTIYDWLQRDYAEQYAQAQEARADVLFDELVEIADAPMTDKVEVMQAKLKIDTRKWIMSRMKPKKYGDKVDVSMDGKVTHDGTVNVAPTDLAIQRIDEIIGAAIGAREEKRVQDAGED